MIKKLDDNLWRITKEFSPFVLLMFYQSQPEIIRLKVFEQKQLQQEPKRYHYKDFTYVEMPDLIRFNFQNLSEIFEEIRIASVDCFQFQPEAGVLRVALQIGSKLKQCLFQLDSTEYSYIETIELLLSQTQREMSRIELPQETSGKEMRELKVVNESHTKEISKFYALLALEREERLKMQEQFQANLTDLRTEIYQLRLSQRKEHSSISSQPHYHNAYRPVAEISSAIFQERPKEPEKWINLVEENYMSKIEAYNNNLKLSQFRFRFDQNSGSDKDHAFEFAQRQQRITYRKKDQTHRQFASLLQCSQPICLVNFKLIQSKLLTIYVGVLLLEQVKKRSTTRNENAISYKLCGGELWQDGVRAKGTTYQRVCPGEVLSLLLDGRNNSMQWWKSGKLLAERVMPLTFQNKQVYPFVDMIHYGDCIEMA